MVDPPVLAQLAGALHDAPVGLDPLCQRGVTLAQYRGFLERAYGFHAPLEAMLPLAPGLRAVNLRARAKAGLIASDLLALGVRPAAITDLPLCDAVPAFATTDEALGWLYGVERATLGFELARAGVLRIGAGTRSAPPPTAFLAGYGADAEERWRDLCAAIVRLATTPRAQAAVVRGARRAAHCQAQWLIGAVAERSPSYGSG